MATTGSKKEIKVDIEIDPFAESDGKAVRWALDNKDIKKALKPIAFKGKAELDSRDWTDKKLGEEAQQAVRMGLKIFSARLMDAMKAAGGDKRGKKDDAPKGKGKAKGKDDPVADAVQTLIDEYNELADDVSKGLDKWLENLASGKADSAKSLKDCGTAFKQIGRADIAQVYAVPRGRAAEALEKLSKAGGRGGKGPDDRALQEARDDLSEAIDEFEQHGRQVADAVKTLLSAAKSTEGNRKNDADLQAFGEKIRAVAKKEDFRGLADEADKLGRTLAEALKAVEDGKTDPQSLRSQIQALHKTAGLDKLAGDAVKAMDKLRGEFDKIKGKLK
jgi:hypothetical protein